MSRKRIKPIIETIPGYTEQQSRYLRGEISKNELDGRFFRWLAIKAEKIGDKEVMESAQKELEERKITLIERNIEKARKRSYCLFKGETPPLIKTKTTVYSNKELNILNGI